MMHVLKYIQCIDESIGCLFISSTFLRSRVFKSAGASHTRCRLTVATNADPYRPSAPTRNGNMPVRRPIVCMQCSLLISTKSVKLYYMKM